MTATTTLHATLYSHETERALIGCVLLNPDLMASLPIHANEFHNQRHAVIWRTLDQMRANGQDIDYLTLSKALQKIGWLDEIGGDAYLTRLIAETPTSLHAETYAQIITEKARRRSLVDIATGIAKTAYDEKANIDGAMPGFIEQIVSTAQIKAGARPLSEYMSELYDDIAARSENPCEVWGIPSGLAKYDRMTGGIQRSELTILSGAPSMGKSMLGMQMATSMGYHRPGAIYSIEMKGLNVARRLVSAYSQVPTRALKTGNIGDDQWSVLAHAIEIFADLPVYMSDGAEWTTTSMRADLARLKAQHNIEWFLVDYLFLLQDGAGSEEIERTALASAGLRRITRELDLAGIAIHSMTKAGVNSSSESSAAPGQAHLRGSGQVIYDADVITFLTGYTPGNGMEAIPTRDQKNMRVLWFAKGRELEDANGYILLTKHPQYPRFAEYAPEAQR